MAGRRAPAQTSLLFRRANRVGFGADGQVAAAAALGRVRGAAARRRVGRAPINHPRRQLAAVDGLGQDARDLLRERAVLGRGAPLQSLFQIARDLGSDENPFPVDHCGFVCLSPTEDLGEL